MIASHLRYYRFVARFVDAATVNPFFRDLERMRREGIQTAPLPYEAAPLRALPERRAA